MSCKGDKYDVVSTLGENFANLAVQYLELIFFFNTYYNYLLKIPGREVGF